MPWKKNGLRTSFTLLAHKKWQLNATHDSFFNFNPHSRTFLHCWERERKRNIDVREKHQSIAFLCTTWPGIESTTWVCALTRNSTLDLSVYRNAPTNWATPARATRDSWLNPTWERNIERLLGHLRTSECRLHIR